MSFVASVKLARSLTLNTSATSASAPSVSIWFYQSLTGSWWALLQLLAENRIGTSSSDVVLSLLSISFSGKEMSSTHTGVSSPYNSLCSCSTAASRTSDNYSCGTKLLDVLAVHRVHLFHNCNCRNYLIFSATHKILRCYWSLSPLLTL